MDPDVSEESAALARQHMLRAQMLALGMRAAYELHRQAFARRRREGAIDAAAHTAALEQLRAATLDTLQGGNDEGVLELLGATAAGEPDVDRGALGFVQLKMVGPDYDFAAQKARMQELSGREFPEGRLPDDLQNAMSFLLGSAVMSYRFVANHKNNKLLMERVHTVAGADGKSELAIPPAVTDPATSTVVVDGDADKRVGIVVLTAQELHEADSAGAAR